MSLLVILFKAAPMAKRVVIVVKGVMHRSRVAKPFARRLFAMVGHVITLRRRNDGVTSVSISVAFAAAVVISHRRACPLVRVVRRVREMVHYIVSPPPPGPPVRQALIHEVVPGG